MADSADNDEFDFYRPVLRGLLPIDTLHIPRRLLKTLRHSPFTVTVNTAFETVIDACAQKRKKRPTTWINAPIRNIFAALHRAGHAHSVECWKDGRFAGGIYGLAIGGVFCGESMVSFETDASKVALVHLCARLWKGGFTVFDTQFTNPHLEQFGIYEIPQAAYEKIIAVEMEKPADFILRDETQERLLEEYLEMRGD